MLRALCEYYDCLRAQPDNGLVSEGYSKVQVNYNLVLRRDGTIKEILPYTREEVVGKKIKTVGREEIFPFRNSISGIAAETIDHREKYIFGLELDKATGTLAVSNSSLKAFEKCRQVNEKFLSDIDIPVARAYLAFMKTWNPEEQRGNPALTALDKAYAGAKFVITLEGEEGNPLNSRPEVCSKWERERESDNSSDESKVKGQCAISGHYLPIARTHDKISGIRGGQPTGVNIVCFNNTAFESYGKEQSYNSSISVQSMKKYTAALNYLTASDKHRQTLGDITLLYWVNTAGSEKPYLDLMSFALFGNTSGETDDELLSAVMRKFRDGTMPDTDSLDMSAQFYILGVKPNASRLSVKLFERSAFGKLMENVARHCNDLSFSPDDRQLALWELDRALQSPISQESCDPALQAKLLISIIKGLPYPQTLFNTVVRRCRVDRDDRQKNFSSVSPARARIIKACLIRKNYLKEDTYNMLQENSTDTAYNLGRLFAVLEKVQADALRSVNASIKDKFFSSACSTPYLVFPRLLKLTQAHLSKLGDGSRIYYDKLIQSVTANIGEFPKTVNMEGQGMFILGYYQQKQNLYTKTEKGAE